MATYKCENCGREAEWLDGQKDIYCAMCGYGKLLPLITQTAPVAEVPCSGVLCTLRPNGEPHPAMISIYAYADEIEDKEPERSDSICSLAMQLEEKLWKMAVGA